MADDVKKTQDVWIGNPDSDQPQFGAYSPQYGRSLSRDISLKTPYAMLDKNGQLSEYQQNGPVSPDTRWLRELGITSADSKAYQQAWQTDDQLHRKSNHEWRDSYGGRLATRAWSRGIAGAIGYAWGQYAGGKYLKDYAFSHDNPSINTKVTNPLEFAARVTDLTLGKALYKIHLKLNGGDVKKATEFVTFRPTNSWEKYGKNADGTTRMGRSFGNEGIGITFDFGVMSLTDYYAREIANTLDPNSDKPWLKEGHIDVKQAAKGFLKTTWVGVTRAMGEDYFAMAAGYPYVVKWSRNTLNKFSPGFGYDSDRWCNGGSVKVDDNGKIIGNYQLEGMADLSFRFTVYNIFTKIFRDGYDKTAGNLRAFWNGDRTIHMPHMDEAPSPENLLKKGVEGVGHALKYLARTIIKTTIIMVPSSGLFAFIRSAQSKDIGLAINEKHGPVGVMRQDGSFSAIFAGGQLKTAGGKRSENPISENTQFYFRNEPGNPNPIDLGKDAQGRTNKFAFAPDKRQGYEQRYDYFSRNDVWHDKLTNPVGHFCYRTGHTLTEAVKPIARFFGFKDMGAVSGHVQRVVDAGLAYGPYFGLKTDVLGFSWDNPKMDMGIDRTIDGVTHCNIGEAFAGMREVKDTIINKPFEDPARQALVQKKMHVHTDQIWSSPDEIYAKDREDEAQQRMEAALVQGKPIRMGDLYRKSFTDRVRQSGAQSANDSYYAQNITPLPKRTPEDYKKSDNQQEWKKQAGSSWHDRAIAEYQNANSSQGQTVN